MYYVEILFVRIGVEYIQGRPCTSDSFGSNCGQIVHYIETKYLSVLQIVYSESEVSVLIFETATKFHLYGLHLPFSSPLVDLDKNTHHASTVFLRSKDIM